MEKKVEGLNYLIQKAVDEAVFPGANYCLLTDKEEFYGSFGCKSLIEKKEENDINTLYDMASCTKVVATTTCIFLLLEEGSLRLYDPVKRYVPRFRYENITIWDLLTHSSGLPADVVRSSKIASREEALDRIFDALVVYEKNTKIVYSDIGFILLGLVVESIAKMPLEEFAQKRIFDELEMTSTGYNPSDVKRCAPTEERKDTVYNGILRGKVHDEKAYILGGVAGHAGLFSCVNDLSHFLRMILDNGMYKGKQFLSRASIDLMFTPQVEGKNGVSLDNEKRGLGWIVGGNYRSCGDLTSSETIHHTGFTGTSIFVDRINRVAFTLLSNRVHPTRQNTLIIPFRGKLGNYIISHFGGRNGN